MTISGTLGSLSIVSKGVKYSAMFGKYLLKLVKRPALEVTDSRVLPQYDRQSGPPFKPIDFRIKVENVGKTTVYDLRSGIYFSGIIGPVDDPAVIITVDTMGFWEQKEGPGISLHGDESEWLNVLRVVQDYQNGAAFDSGSDVYLTFPTDEGWEPQGRIEMKFSDRDTILTNNNIPMSEAKHLKWTDAYIEIRGEDKNSNKISYKHEINMSYLRKGMDNRRALFQTIDEFGDGD